MMLKETLKNVALLQRKELESMDSGTPRRILKNIDLKIPHVSILSGIRRSGKSVLLKQMIEKTKRFYYFNFEDQRAIGFEIGDFETLNSVMKEEFGEKGIYFFDEIQNIDGWERFARRMHDLGSKFVITGSNASLLSKELGTKLTGRHLSYEVFPFSYLEMLDLLKETPSLKSFEKYMQNGGFPEFLKYKNIEMLRALLNDVLNRDIIMRHGIREVKTIKEMAVFLLTNIGKEFSFTNLTKQFNLGSTNTTSSYISYFEDSYLLFTVPKFDFSYRKQLVNPKKVYSIDVQLSRINSASFSEDKGRMLENIVFLELRRKFKDIFYFRGKGECDFLVKDRDKVIEAIQVCYELTEENKNREISGLKEAMEKLKIKNGIILTMKQKDKLSGIKIVPVWKWLLS